MGYFGACLSFLFVWFWVALRFVLGYDMSFSIVPLRFFLICFTSFLICFTSFPDLLYVFLSLLSPFPDLLYTFSVLWIQIIRGTNLVGRGPPCPVLQPQYTHHLLLITSYKLLPISNVGRTGRGDHRPTNADINLVGRGHKLSRALPFYI